MCQASRTALSTLQCTVLMYIEHIKILKLKTVKIFIKQLNNTSVILKKRSGKLIREKVLNIFLLDSKF